MATLIEAHRVNYLCSCKRLKPLSSLYFCKYCEWLTLKCTDCVFHEIDQKYFCPNCFDNKSNKEVVALKYKCSNCYSCPSCKNLLMIRASTSKNKEVIAAAAAAAAAAQEAAAKTPSTTSESGGSTPATQPATPQAPQLPKVFYLMCGFCRWSTRDAGIPDALSTPGGWKLPDNPNFKRIKELLDAYQVIATREKLEKERKRYATTKSRRFHLSGGSPGNVSGSGGGGGGTNSNAISGSGIGLAPSSSSSSLLSDKYGILGPLQRRQMAATGAQAKIDLTKPFDEYFRSLVKAGETVDSFEPLSADFYTKEINISTITSIAQRHANPDFQPTRFNELYPLNKFYLSKESKRCTGCEHNVLKPESNITSIKFKLHQMALFSVPEVRIVTIPEWKLNEPNEVILSVTNRCEFDVNVSFSPLCLEVTESTSGENAGFVIVNSFRSNSTISFGVNENTASLTTTTIKIDRQDNAKSQGPAALTPNDIETSLGLLVLRRDNKIAVTTRIRINNPDTVSRTGENVRCAFEMKFSNANVSSNAAAGGSFPATSTPYLPGSESSSSTNTPSSPPTSNVTATATPLATPSIISSAAASPVISTAQASASAQVVKIFLDLGPINLKDGFKPVPIPKYIDDCLAVTDKKYAL